MDSDAVAYVLMQLIKESSTVRVGSKGKSGSPRIVYSWGSQDNEIKNFIDYRKRFKNISRKNRKHNDYEEAQLFAKYLRGEAKNWAPRVVF